MTFRSIWSGTRRPRKLMFQSSECTYEEAWRKVPLFQHGLIINWEGLMKAVFSDSGVQGVMMDA